MQFVAESPGLLLQEFLPYAVHVLVYSYAADPTASDAACDGHPRESV